MEFRCTRSPSDLFRNGWTERRGREVNTLFHIHEIRGSNLDSLATREGICGFTQPLQENSETAP
jgi:hypothetical protein